MKPEEEVEIIAKAISKPLRTLGQARDTLFKTSPDRFILIPALSAYLTFDRTSFMKAYLHPTISNPAPIMHLAVTGRTREHNVRIALSEFDEPYSHSLQLFGTSGGGVGGINVTIEPLLQVVAGNTRPPKLTAVELRDRTELVEYVQTVGPFKIAQDFVQLIRSLTQ